MKDGRTPILYLAPWVDFGGSDKGTIDWFRWLDRSRFAPSLITTQPSANRRLAEVVPFAEEVWPLPDLMVGDRFPSFIADFIVSRDVAVVHVMNARIGYDLLPDLRALDRPPKIVVQLHVEEPTGDGYVRYVTTRYGNLVDAFSVSSAHLGAAVRDYGVSPDRIVVIPTGVDAEGEFCPERVTPRRGLSPELVRILYPGRLVDQKDPLMMVEVARELEARGLRFRIHVVGAGDLEPAVHERVRAHGLEHRVVLEPPTGQLAPWYRASDLLLMTSRFEGVPYVIYEALAMGVPVVAPALPGNIELMNGVGGALVERRDRASAYADALEPLIRDRELRGRTGEAGRQLVLDRYSLREMADRHAELYDGLCSQDSARSGASAGEPADPPPPARISFPSRPANGTPRVSIVTPCFNHGRWLRECIDAVRHQTYPDVEMIVVDDASTDRETIAYMAELALDTDVDVVRMPENSGPSVARNCGLERSTGRYVLPVDADNVLLPDAVERLVAQLQGAGEHVGYIYPNVQYFGNREDYFEPPAFNPWLLTRGNFADNCSLIDREVFDHGFRYPEDIFLGHEDWDFFLTLTSHGIEGEPARAKTVRYRKHGFTRSDLVEWSGRGQHVDPAARHPALFPAGHRGHTRGNNPHVRLKARWAPALTVIALAPVELDSPAWHSVAQSLRRQHLRDFELCAATDREPEPAPDLPPLRPIPGRLRRRPAEALAYSLERSGARNIVVTHGTGAELLSDPGSLERIVRLLEHGCLPIGVGFAASGDSEAYPFAVLPGDDPDLQLHSLAWSRRHEAMREPPPPLDRGDPIGDLARWLQLRRIGIEWRALPAVSVLDAPACGRRFAPVAAPRQLRAEAAERQACVDAPPCLPGPLQTIPRWAFAPNWSPCFTTPLIRHRRAGCDQWLTTAGTESPAGFHLEHSLGLVYVVALEGMARIVRDPEQGYTAIARAAEPDADEMARTLGYVDQVAFPLLEPLMLGRHRETGAAVLICGADDPLRTAVVWPEAAVLGWVERLPVNPRTTPVNAEATAWLRGLLRAVDPAARRHRAAIGAAPPGDGVWELGALLDRDPGGGIPVWTDAEGRLHTPDYAAKRSPYSLRRTLRWTAAPAAWRGFGRPLPRTRAVARRSLDGLRYTIVRPGLAHAGTALEPQGWLMRNDGPDRIEVYSAIHPVTADQLVTRDPSEARELGYEALRTLGYALALAPVTGTLGRPRAAVPWGSRFGQLLTRAEDPYPDEA